jgi:hypothetical protein
MNFKRFYINGDLRILGSNNLYGKWNTFMYNLYVITTPMKKKVSFDFDSTLDRPFVQEFAKEMIERGLEVWIVTSRPEKYEGKWVNFDPNNDDLFKVADELGIPRNRIHFTNHQLKADFFRENKGFLWHLDDDWVELRHINSETKTKGISCFGSGDWKRKCERVMK